MCVGQVGNLLPHVVVPAVMAGHLIPQWDLSASQAGLMASAFALGYMLAVPFLTALTDRMDARLILLAGSAVSGLATFSFGLLSQGLWSEVAIWAIAGAGFAGAYMPGLKALVDRLPPGDASRSITLYTATFSIGVGLSFLIAQVTANALGWRIAFYVTALGPLAMIAACLGMARVKPDPSPASCSTSSQCSAIGRQWASYSATGPTASSSMHFGRGSLRSGPTWRRATAAPCCLSQ
jgi:MFS family permease